MVVASVVTLVSPKTTPRSTDRYACMLDNDDDDNDGRGGARLGLLHVEHVRVDVELLEPARVARAQRLEVALRRTKGEGHRDDEEGVVRASSRSVSDGGGGATLAVVVACGEVILATCARASDAATTLARAARPSSSPQRAR